jgi:formyltetrahydrofolate synthetase
MTLTINNFTPTNTVTGNMAQAGRTSNTDLQIILTQRIIMNNLVSTTNVPGTPGTISNGPLYNIAHMCSSFINVTLLYAVDSNSSKKNIFY